MAFLFIEKCFEFAALPEVKLRARQSFVENGHHRDKHLRGDVGVEAKELLEVHRLVSGERNVEEFADLF